MFKVWLTFLFGIVCVSEGTVIKVQPYIPDEEFGFPNDPFLRSTDEIISNWGPHVMDFVKLLDVQKMTMVAMQYMSDPEVMLFMKFLLSPQFKDLIWDFEMMEEFKEVRNNKLLMGSQAFVFLASKGYDVESIINFVNTALSLPPFEKPKFVSRNEKGITGFLEAMIGTLPIEDMKTLFESKLQTSPEVADLFEAINSQEFMDIMRRMRGNPKFTEFKVIFEGYGFDFKFLCRLAKEIFGDYYQGVFCE